MAHALLQTIAFFYLDETYAPKILGDRTERLRKSSGNDLLHTQWTLSSQSLTSRLSTNIVRPVIMLSTQPAIQVLGLYRAYFYGVKYLL